MIKDKDRFREIVAQMTYIELLFEYVRLYFYSRRKKE